jgi:membrane protein DedA with SNARE-associated domain
MKMGYGFWVVVLGILGIIAGGAIYAAYAGHHRLGLAGIGLGGVLIIIGAVWWWMGNKASPKATAPQPTQPAKTS